jgi:hypothetical protein
MAMPAFTRLIQMLRIKHPQAGEQSSTRRPSDAGTELSHARQEKDDALADIAGDQSFPASDPPCWTLGRGKQG